jgi:hypothetical protein
VADVGFKKTRTPRQAQADLAKRRRPPTPFIAPGLNIKPRFAISDYAALTPLKIGVPPKKPRK